ncbi:MAG: RluA family pseudouridine synthase [Anaerolineae bacterium]|nr:RluA family pseudouridine synthase [Anaerolineae bacterium]
MAESAAEIRRWVVSEGGGRLDQHLAASLASLSRSQARRLIEEGAVLVNGRPGKPALLVQAGDEVEVRLPAAVSADIAPEPVELQVVYESADVVVVDKPAGVLVHPTSHDRSGTLVNGLLWRYPEVQQVGPPERRGVVHRLDRDTSGLVVFGRTMAGLRGMQEQFRRHEVWKTYLALLVGAPSPDAGVINAPVGRHPKHRGRQAVLRRGGKPARTQYETLERLGEYSLVRAHPLTGRTHQIRVHFAALRHPIAGDPLYGRGHHDLGLQRQFLHASGLRFRDPGTGELVSLESPLPKELQYVLDELRQRAGGG